MTELDLEPRRTALVLIDLMSRIVEQPTAPSTGAEVLDRCVALAAATRAAGGLVVHVRVERPGVAEQPPGSGFAPESTPRPGDVEIVKGTWGAFHNTGLDEVLRAHGIETVVLGGLMTNFGVESTGRIADEYGYRVVFVSDAMASIDEYAHTFALDYIFARLGTVTTTGELLAKMRQVS